MSRIDLPILQHHLFSANNKIEQDLLNMIESEDKNTIKVEEPKKEEVKKEEPTAVPAKEEQKNKKRYKYLSKL